MGLTAGEIKWINEWVSDGYDLSEILFEHFSGLKISIIKRHCENLSGNYIHDAYFDREESEEAIKKISKMPSEEFSPCYYIIEGSLGNLLKGKIFDERMGFPIDSSDGMIIYSKLEKKLKQIL